ncbi:F420 dehydrogenase subunit K FpoK [methanogenic archaeon mixed culture ISO4-G1]|nr:F420 dehydrogenase subunit K FpoK [methanogenic archaeon mixed culture ISO4-G1]
MIPMEYFLVLSAILFVIGAYGVLTKSNAIVVLMCIELMLNAANINFVTFAAYNVDIIGQAFVIMSISVAAAEVAVGIAILLNAYKHRKTTELDDAELTTMRW